MEYLIKNRSFRDNEEALITERERGGGGEGGGGGGNNNGNGIDNSDSGNCGNGSNTERRLEREEVLLRERMAGTRTRTGICDNDSDENMKGLDLCSQWDKKPWENFKLFNNKTNTDASGDGDGDGDKDGDVKDVKNVKDVKDVSLGSAIDSDGGYIYEEREEQQQKLKTDDVETFLSPRKDSTRQSSKHLKNVNLKKKIVDDENTIERNN
jgi:hypothetical protein